MAHLTECTVSELNLFGNESIQTSIIDKKEVAHYPINSLDGATSIEFLSSGQSSYYRDLSNIMLKIKVQILRSTGSPYKSTAKTNNVADASQAVEKQPAFAANTLHSLFKSIQVSFNNKTVFNHDLYPYKAYLELITNFSSDAIDKNFSSSGAILDVENKFENVDNRGFATRRGKTSDGKLWTLYGRISLDISNQQKLMLNNLDIRFNFQLSSPQFALIGEDGTDTFKISEAVLYINQNAINPNILLHHARLLNQTKIRYPYMRNIVKAYTLPSKLRSTVIENLFVGVLPSFLIITFVDNIGFTGVINKNPFFFQDFKLKRLQLFKNNEPIPGEPIDMTDSSLARPYTFLLDQLDIYNTNKTIPISQNNLNKGYFLMAFNLTPLSQNNQCNNIQSDGNLRVNLEFSENLAESITFLIYASVPDVLEIDRNYNVTTRFQ